ncbi:hypothetical protein ACQP1G_30240 [Nocardia sp. CA-107356]
MEYDAGDEEVEAPEPEATVVSKPTLIAKGSIIERHMHICRGPS